MHMVLLKGGKMIVNKLAVKGNSVFILGSTWNHW